MTSTPLIFLSEPSLQCEGQCDCACASIQVEIDLSNENFYGGKIFELNKKLEFILLDGNQYLVFNPCTGQNIAIISSIALDILDQFRSAKKIEEVLCTTLSKQQLDSFLGKILALGYVCPVSQ